jgi:hypothetical protein
MVTAAANGYTEIMEWSYANGCPLDAQTMEYTVATADRDFETVKWLHERHCPWDYKACRMAANANRLDILQWLYQRGCPLHREVHEAATRFGNAEMLGWLVEQGCTAEMALPVE